MHLRRRRISALSSLSFSAIIDSCGKMDIEPVQPPVIPDSVDSIPVCEASIPLEAAIEVPMEVEVSMDVDSDVYLWLSDFNLDGETDAGLEKYDFGLGNSTDFCDDSNSCDSTVTVDTPDAMRTKVFASLSVAGEEQEVVARGLRNMPHPELLKAGKGKEKSPSANNDRWALRRADQLRKSLGWNMKVAFGDMQLDEIDELLSNLFARVVKVSGEEYPASTLMNMLGGFNRIIRRASDLRALKGIRSYQVEKDFNIKKHPQFTKTRLVLLAAVKRTAKEGINKKTVKVEIMTEAMEEAIMADLEHQVTDNQGCQKLLALFLMLRCGIRGGKELYNLQRKDINIEVDREGREFVKFEERHSKNNNHTLDRYGEHQFRKTFHSYEERFVVCVKQYQRHMPPIEESEPDLFLQTITHPATIVWYNRVQKTGRDKVSAYLKNMALLVGIPPDVFSNKSGRATLITRLCARGVPDEVGMLISGHHTTDGYLRYDRSQALKMEAANVVSANPEITYETALATVSKKFVDEKIVGNAADLHPLVMPTAVKSEASGSTLVASSSDSSKALVERVRGNTMAISMCEQVKESEKRILKISDQQQLTAWHADYDGINWDEEIEKNPRLQKALGGCRSGSSQVSIGSRTGSSYSGNSFVLGSHCTINFICPEENKENKTHN